MTTKHQAKKTLSVEPGPYSSRVFIHPESESESSPRGTVVDGTITWGPRKSVRVRNSSSAAFGVSPLCVLWSLQSNWNGGTPVCVQETLVEN